MRFFSLLLPVTARAVCLLASMAGLSSEAHAFTHPCIPSTTQDLDYIKANLNREPWKSGYAQLLASWNPNYTPQPYATVSRSPNVNLTAWSKDMSAVCNYARLWYFTGNNAYAQKAHDILLAWANTQTFMGGNEAGLALGDVAIAYGEGASILRGTWPGWTAADTAAVKNLFANVYWPATATVGHLVGPANKGSLNMEAGMAIALFCDDTDKFNHVLDLYRTYPGSGLVNTLPTGEMGETGRDAGHAYGDLLGKVFVAECAWKQGIDLYSEWDNRLLAVGEYYCRNTYIMDNPFVDYGTVDYLYTTNAKGPYVANRAAFYLIQNAYKNRKGLPTPWIDKKMQEQSLDGGNFVFAKTTDFTTATPPAAIVRPPVSLASSGLTLTTLGNNSAGRSVSYANGVWTMTGAGVDVWGDVSDDCQFAYQQMTGDCAIVARVTSSQSINGATKAGVMIRDNLSAAVSQRGYAAVIPNTGTNQVQSRLAGDTERWAGRVAQGTNLPSPGMPYWVKVERRGLMLTAYTSPDGTSWSPNVSNYFANLPSSLYIGLFVVSGSATTTTTATFDHVAFTGGTGGLVTTPAAPARLLAVGSSKAITLRWLPSFDATAYDLLRSGTSGSGYTVIASNLPADKTSYMDTTPAAGTTYYYVVRAKNSAGTSGNSPEFYGSLLPPPLVNLAFSGAANDSANNPANAASAFDQNPGTQWFYTGTTGWLSYDFGAGNAQLVKRYTVSEAITIPARDPKDWQFQGSQDGSTWTTLDTQISQTFSITYQQLTYDIANTTAYRYYRLNVTANNGDATFLHVGDLGLWGDAGRTIPDGTCVIASRNTNKVVDVTGTANGSQVVQQTFAGDDTQQWNLAWQGNGRYRATNVAATKVIDNGGTSGVGANLVIQPSTGGTSQLWTVAPDSDGFYRITSANSGLVTAVSGNSTADGANIVQGTYTGGDSQLWMPSGAAAPQPTPPAPVVTATAASISQIDLSWTASPGAIHYNIKRSDVSGGPYTTAAAEVSGTSYSDTYLTSGTTYYYVVSAVNGSGEGANSAQVQATTLTGVPPAPTGISETLGTNRVVLNWTATGGATSYTVKRATSVNGPYTTLASGLTSPTYTDTSRTTDIAYYYIVIADNAFGSSPDSAPLTVAPGTLSILLKFDETGGAIAADSSGGGHDATLFNNPAFAVGLLDNALNLPGTATQYAKLPSGIMSGLTDFTIATWIKVNSFATWQRIFDFGTSTTNFMYLTTQYTATAPNAAKLRLTIRTPSVVDQNVEGTGVALAAGAWTHVAVTRSGNTVSLYVNGALVGSGTVTINPSDLGVTTQNYLGKSQFGNDPYLNAALDDFRLYAHAMTPAEITALTQPPAGAPRQLAALPGNTLATLGWAPNATTTYTIKRSGTSGGPYTIVADGVTSTTYTDTGLTNGVTYYYVIGGANAGGPGPDSAEIAVTPGSLNLHLKFDENSGSTAADSSGNNRNGTTFNSPAWTAGRLGNALNLDGVNQYVGLPSGIVSGLNDFTIATWVYWNGGNNWQRIFDFGSSTSTYMFLSPNNGANGRLRFAITSGSGEQIIDSNAVLPSGGWQHVAVTLSGSTGTLYVNGVQVGQNTAMSLRPANLGVTTQNRIGRSQFNDPYLNGSVDNFRLYSTGLSASSIAMLANPMQTTGLTATGGSGQIALAWDSTLNATSYTVRRASTSGTAYTTLASNVTDTNYTDTGLADGTTYYYVITPANLSGEGANSGEVSAITLAAAPANVTATVSNAQVLISWSASATADSYDVLRATSIGGPYTTLASGLIITDYTDTTAIPERTYYYAVAAVNSSGPNQSASATVTTPAIAMCWLQFDETSGTVAADSSGRGQDAALLNGPVFVAGRINNGLNFSAASSQYATLPTGVVNGLADFTISTWVKVSGTSKNTRIFDFGTATNNYMELCPKTSSNGYMRYEIVSGGTVKQINTTYAFPTGVWTHVALTQSGSTGTLYINGTSVGTNAGLTLKPSNLGATTLNYVGRSQWSSDPYLDGVLDDFRIYAHAMSAAEIASVASGPPAAPQNVTATAVGSSQIDLAWAAVSGAASYNVKRSLTSGSGYTTVASGETLASYSDSGLTNGTTYYYVVSAVNLAGESADSTEASATSALPPAPVITSAASASGTNGSAFSYQITASNSPTSFGATGLPAGLSVNTSTGVISGTPSVAGTSSVTISASNAGGTGNATLTITILPPVPSITSALSVTGTNGSAFSYQITATYSPASFGATGLPVGLSVNTSTGLISGTPSASGTTNVTISATNITGTGSATLTLTILVPPPSITSATSVTGTSGSAFNYQITATNSPSSFGAIGLPTGLSVNTSTGLISGTPSTTGTASVTLSAINSTGTGSATLALSVLPPIPSVPTGLIASGSNASVILRWSASSGAASYNVKRSLTSGSGYVTVASPADAACVDIGVANGTTYYYVVSAVNSTGESVNSSEVRATPDSNSLIAFLRFDETSGAVAAESCGHGWNGALMNGAGWSAGRINNAVGLVSSGTQHVILPSGIAKGVTDFTISVWVKLNTVSNWTRIFDFGTGTTTYMFLSPQNSDNSKARFSITNTGNKSEQRLDAASGIPTGTWTHVAVTLSGSTGTIYLNGIASGTNNAMTLNPASLGNTTQNYIGKSQFNDPYLNGLVDQFQFYSRALSPTEVAALAAPPLAPSGVVATGSNASVIVSWNPVSGATGYNVLRSLTGGSGYSTTVSAVTGTSYTDTGLTNGTRYYYQVTALNGLAESSTSSEVSAIPDGTPPVVTVPANIDVYATGANGAVVTFSTSASDAISGPCATTNVPPSGSVFPIGTTTVTTTAVDASGNAGSATFTVSVQTLPISSNEQHGSTFVSLTGSTGTLIFASPVAGHSYQLQYCDDLRGGSWQNYGSPQIGDSASLQFNLPVTPGQPRRFYRVQIEK